MTISAHGQISVSGVLIDSITKEALSFANIGIKNKNIGTCALSNGTFSLNIPEQNKNDTLTFSMVGYSELNIPVRSLKQIQQTFQLIPKITQLPVAQVWAKKLKERKVGIVKYNPIGHFTDGSVNQNDIFEIAQLIKLGEQMSKITSVNLYITESIEDSATFRINFYRFDGHRPTSRIVEKSIIQTHTIKEGWLKFDLKKNNVYLKGNVIVAIEFIPSEKKQKQIYYEIKLGGLTKSYVKTSSLGEWRVPPHHYRLYITALGTEENESTKKIDSEENETAATMRLFSKSVNDSFSIFVKLPHGYNKDASDQYPVIYLLDANVYFDIVSNSIKQHNEKQQLPEMILVGIGYKNFLTMDSLRNRDYTFPKASPIDSFAISGGGDKFLAFIENELVPFIDKTYKTDSLNRTIMGHSLGGYFTLFALENDMKTKTGPFKNYISASPSIDYSNEYIIKRFQNFNAKDQNEGLRTLFLTTEGLELEKNEKNNFNQFVKLLSDNKFNTIKMKTEIYSRFSHMETAVPTFEKGLQFIFSSGK